MSLRREPSVKDTFSASNAASASERSMLLSMT